ncbi:MAG: SUMF1/EgtB/PvdO family nonheme iron enzyme [Bacteroidaceae bacterium]|nr:SUMF1/EgtB/PvdO family nonheme iron enzyme [Bacteroidaceae bacterium]
MKLQLGQLLQGGKYRIERVLGQGGYGITYLAEQVALGRQVAIKEFFMRELCGRDAGTSHVTMGMGAGRETVRRFREKFLKEARNIASLDHPGIVRIHDVFEENGTAYYVMEYLRGGSLKELSEGRPLNDQRATMLIRKVADALAYIHDRNMLHLDVKPANILLKDADTPVLIDFGISKHYDAWGEQTTTLQAGISKGYAPMEQYRQEIHTFSPSTDIYSLGATMYTLLTGKIPPEASCLLDDEELPSSFPNVCSRTWHAVTQCMQLRRKQRPQSVSEFLQLLGDEDETEVIGNIPAVLQQLERDMVYVEGGTFMMGATAEQGDDADADEKPAHHVTLSSFRICKHEVTQAEWEAVMDSNPSYFKGANRPVENVGWKDCQKFIRRLNQLTGKRYRLPTEAEWEYAARGGRKSQGYKYSGSNSIDNVAWYKGNSSKGTHNVMTKVANELGLYDMSGNVDEWCGDRRRYYTFSSQSNPKGPFWGYHVSRGGCWGNDAWSCRVSSRHACSAYIRLMYRSNEFPCGLRLAL